MNADGITLKQSEKKVKKKNEILIIQKRHKKCFFIIIIVIIILGSFFISFKFLFSKNYNNYNSINNINITELIQNEKYFDDKVCRFIKIRLKNRIQPFGFEDELSFIISLILCKIPFSFIRFSDGEDFIMTGTSYSTNRDNWAWNNTNKKFQDSLIESASICTTPYNFIGIPCKNWYNHSKSILSFSKCTNSKYMSYTSLFYNKNYKFFQNWITKFIKSSNRWKIILVANSLIKEDISWAYKFFPIPEHVIEKWDELSASLLPKLADEVKQKDIIFFVSAGPAANLIISYLVKINNKNIYIDFGSAIEFITKGFSTRSYSKIGGETALLGCESFYLENQAPIYIE